MRGTRRFYATAALLPALALLGVLINRPLPLVGAALVGGWLLGIQYRFARAVARTATDIDAEVAATPARVGTDEPTTVTVTATVPERPPLEIAVTVDPPVAATGSTAAERTVQLGRLSSATTSFTVTIPTAGSYTIDAPRVVVGDRAGLFHESFTVGEPTPLDVEPRGPRDVHIGRGGKEVAVAYGEHDAGRLGTGLDPAELRQYVAGDDADSIDWKATARLGELYVREFEAETDRRTALLVDHRSSLGAGPAGETALDYLREVALLFLASARELDDPIGLYAVDENGLTVALAPETGPGAYAERRQTLTSLAVDGAEPAATRSRGRSPSAARSAAAVLDGDDTPFARTLRPYFATADSYVQRIADDPLFGATRSRLSRLRGTLWTVILTDDTNRAEVREAVKLARRGDDNVLVFLAPRVLFETGGLADLDAAYDAYVEFEEFRRDLAALDRVEALEVAPGDRIGAVLSARRRQHQTRGMGG